MGTRARWDRCGGWVDRLSFCGAPPRGVSEAPLGLALRGAELGYKAFALGGDSSWDVVVMDNSPGGRGTLHHAPQDEGRVRGDAAASGKAFPS